MADDADTHEKDVEELDERMQKLTHKLENARRDFVRSAASDAYAATPSTLGRLGGERERAGGKGRAWAACRWQWSLPPSTHSSPAGRSLRALWQQW